jgi:hypothetical protein
MNNLYLQIIINYTQLKTVSIKWQNFAMKIFLKGKITFDFQRKLFCFYEDAKCINASLLAKSDYCEG